MFHLEGAYTWEVYFTLLALVALCAMWIYRTYGILSALTASWIAFSALRIYAAPTSPFVLEEPLWRTSLELGASSALALVLMHAVAARVMTIRFIKCLGVVNALLMFVNFREGLLLNWSMSGCLSAALFPFYTGPWSWFIGASALYSERSQPVVLLFFVLCLGYFRKQKLKQAAAMTILGFVIGIVVKGALFFDSSGRTLVWKEAWHFFNQYANPFLGLGLGSFFYVGPYMTMHKTGIAWSWLHSDWMQIGFEMGAIGLVLCFSLYVQALYKARRELSDSLLIFGLFGIANFPLHNPVSAFIFSVLLHEALKTSQSTQKRRSNYLVSPRKFGRWHSQFYVKCRLVVQSLWTWF